MGFLNLFSKPQATIQLLPSGSMTVDRNAKILASTVSSSFDQPLLEQIGAQVIAFFRSAEASQIPLTEINLHFASLQISARELRGGAVIFLTPKHAFNVSPN